MDSNYPYALKRRAENLVSALELAVEQDGEQELHTIAAATFDAVLREAKTALPDDPVVPHIPDVAASMAESGGGLRAVDALLVARQVDAALGPTPVILAF